MIPNERVRDILRDISKERLEYQIEGYKHIRDVDYTELAEQIVGETIMAILCTNHLDEIYTQFDIDRIQVATSKIVDAVRNHWKFQ